MKERMEGIEEEDIFWIHTWLQFHPISRPLPLWTRWPDKLNKTSATPLQAFILILFPLFFILVIQQLSESPCQANFLFLPQKSS